MSNLTPGPEMDRDVCEALGIESERVCIVTEDGGESCIASVNKVGGPWKSDIQLSDWLIEQKVKGYHLNAVIDYWYWCPRVSTDLSCLGLLVEALGKRGIRVTMGPGHEGRYAWLDIPGEFLPAMHAYTLSLALCLAIISARDAGRIK